MATYKRVLLKLSGEALKSTGSELFDFPMVRMWRMSLRKCTILGRRSAL